MQHKCLHQYSEKIFIAKHIRVCVVLPDCDLEHEFNGLSSGKDPPAKRHLKGLWYFTGGPIVARDDELVGKWVMVKVAFINRKVSYLKNVSKYRR